MPLEKYAKGAPPSGPYVPGTVDLTIRLGDELLAWEKDIVAVFIYRNDSSQYEAEFNLNTGISSLRTALWDAIVPVMADTQFTLASLEPCRDKGIMNRSGSTNLQGMWFNLRTRTVAACS